MLNHIEEAVALAEDPTRATLDSDRVFSLALTKLVEIVCEAATRTSEPTQATHSEIPWRELSPVPPGSAIGRSSCSTGLTIRDIWS